MEATIERFVRDAHAAGCPRDQIERFLRAGVVLQPKQLLASATARQMDISGGPVELGYGGARGGGKSHWMLAQMAVDDCQRYAGLKCLLLRKVGKSVKEAFEDLRPRLLGRVAHEWVPTRNTLIFPNSSRILLGNFRDEGDIDKYLGLEYDVIGVEEATTLSWRKYQAIQSVNRTSKPGWRPRIYTTTNPGGVGHAWYKNRFVKPARTQIEAETRFIQATVDDNSFVNPEYKGKLDQLTGWLLRAWRYGDWDIAAGQFFTTFRNDVHVREPFKIPSAWRVWCAMDYGFVHYTVVHLLAQDDDGNLYHVDEHAARRWQVAQHVEAIKAMLARWDVTLERLWTFVAGADVFARKDDGPTIAEKYKKLGIRLKTANTDRINGWAEMLARLGDVEAKIEPRWFIFNTCERLIETLPMLEHDPNRPEDVLKVDVDDDGIGGDDAADCARYGVMAAWRPKMSSAQVDWYGRPQTAGRGPQPARADDEIERILSEYGE
ncbi:MAG: phage terminase large subunit [Anaerolineae bacterium]|nr:phage terminase large subunit [Anaerolineae bacterium]